MLYYGQDVGLEPKEIAKMIRPLIGLNTPQARANVKYFEHVKSKSGERQAVEAAAKYASRQLRQRAEMIAHTELAFAYNRGAHESVRAAVDAGLMSPCEKVWSTAGSHRVCSRCRELNGKVVGFDEPYFSSSVSDGQTPPLHPRCRCVIVYREIKGKPAEMYRRWRAQDGHEVIDKPTYNKLTKSFLKAGGVIIRGEEAKRHLKLSGASASYLAGANVAFIADDARVSDVLEEMYHAYQDRAKMFGDLSDKEVLYRREIDAQKYLLRVAQKYKIPPEETAVTLENLKYYEEQLAKHLEGSE